MCVSNMETWSDNASVYIYRGVQGVCWSGIELWGCEGRDVILLTASLAVALCTNGLTG